MNVIGLPGTYVEATLNNAGGVCDNSPVFADSGIPYVCLGNDLLYSPGVSDPDGNTMVFSLIDARQNVPPPTPVNYQPGFTGAEPLPGMTINPNTGQLNFSPTIQDNFVVVIQVTTYDADGQLIGSVMRDLMFVAVPCDGSPPATDGLANAQNALVTSPFEVEVCDGVAFCVDITFTDDDPANVIAIVSDAAAQLPGATFQVNVNVPAATATLCWTPDADLLPITIYVQAEDGQCPIMNLTSASFIITESEPPPFPPDAGTNGNTSACPTGPSFPLFPLLGGTPDAGGIWTDPGGAAHSGTFVPGTDPFGAYTYVVGSACDNASATVTVEDGGSGNAGIDGDLAVCTDSAPVDLLTGLGGTPEPGGEWTGPGGLMNGMYDPAIHVPGAYVYTLVAGLCPGASATVTVTEVGAANAGNDGTANLCSTSPVTNLFGLLGAGAEPGGTWAGPSAINGNFDPAIHTPGDYIYTVTGTAPCGNATATITVVVNQAVNAGTNANLNICANGTPVDLFTILNGTPQPGGAWAGPGGAMDGIYDPLVHDPGNYSYTVTGIPPCANATSFVIVTEVAPPNAGEDAAIELCGDAAPVDLFTQLGGTPNAGGTWSGPSPITGVFDPAQHLAGDYVYTVNGAAVCTPATATVSVALFAAANAGDDAALELCSTSAPVDLFGQLAGTPQGGGTWSGPDAITGIFDPAQHAAGDYTYTIPGNNACPDATATVAVTVVPAPDAGADGSIAVCSDQPPVDLFQSLQGTPQPGGTWIGPSAITGMYDPAIHDAGAYMYSLPAVGICPAASAIVTVVESMPADAGTMGSVDLCSSDPAVDLFGALGGTPQGGGTWSGPSVLTGGVFNPATHVPGVYIYTITPAAPCPVSSASVTVNVDLAANAGTDASVTICDAGGPVDLFTALGGTPQAGGDWSGPSQITGMYDPLSHDPGLYTYTVDGGDGCPSASATVTVTETGTPYAGEDVAVAFCTNDDPTDLFSELGGGPDPGGEWSGPSPGFDGVFDPAIHPEGIYTYTLAAIAPCVSDQATVTVTTFPAPDAGEDGSVVICENGGAINLFSSLGGTPQPGGTWNGPNGVFSGMYDPALDVSGDYTYTITGSAPCGSESAVVSVTQTSNPNAGIDASITFCTGDAPLDLFTLLGGSPDAGGTWTGPSADMTGTFDPAVHLPGVYTYSIAATPPCVSDASIVTVSVVEGADAGEDGAVIICETGGAVDLFAMLGGSPQAGGTWSGPSADLTGMFDPAQHLPGTYVYTVTTATCGSASAEVVVTITGEPYAGEDGAITICEGGTAVDLFGVLGGMPDPGGTWSGPSPGFTGIFDPATHAAGVYTYALASTPPCSDDASTVTVTVQPLANAGTSATVELCPGADAQDLFSLLGPDAQADGIWSGPSVPFDGTFDPAIHLPGVYVYTVLSGDCSDDSADVTVSILDGADAGGDASLDLCSSDAPVMLTTQLAGSPDANGTWTDPLGDDVGTTLDPASATSGTYIYTVPGSGDCPSAQAFLQVQISTAPQAGNSGILEICSNQGQVSLFDGLTGTLDAGGTWTDPNGLPHGTIVDPNIDMAGTYQYTVTSGSCPPASATVNVLIFDAPDAGGNATVAFCSSDNAVSLIGLLNGSPDPGGTWMGPDGTPPAAMFIPATSEPGDYVYTVNGSDACGMDQAVVTIIVSEAVTAGTGGAITVCANDGPVQLMDLVGGSPDPGGTWTTPEGITFSGLYVPANGTGGAYTYTVQADPPCASSSSVVMVDVLPVPEPQISATNADACAPVEVTLSHDGTGAASCTWIFGNGTFSQDCGSVTTTYDQAGSYSVTLIMDPGNGCSATTTQAIGLVNVFNRPVADFEALPEVIGTNIPQAYFHNYSQGATSYLWDMDGTGTYTSTHVNHTFPAQLGDEYEVCLIAYASPQCADTICKVVTVGDALNLFVPNAFSPDDDGINDVFRPVMEGIDPQRYHFDIFDRWGSPIFSTTDPNAGWDGRSASGQETPQGVYVWKINMKDSYSGKRVERTGHVTLLR